VERFAPLIWSICRRYRLGPVDAADVSQRVWLRLVDRVAAVRDPAALAGWLATTSQRECAQLQRAARRSPAYWQVTDVEDIPDEQIAIPEEELLMAERHAVLRAALARLPPSYQQLIAMFIEDPPVPYAEISAKLGIPVGSIGPTRRRCLDMLRRDPAIAALINGEPNA
jgi:RNA polymerase sigma factor (sigma-70 family)